MKDSNAYEEQWKTGWNYIYDSTIVHILREYDWLQADKEKNKDSYNFALVCWLDSRAPRRSGWV